MNRPAIYRILDAERLYQEKLWGSSGTRRADSDGPNNPVPHEVGTWLLMMQHYLDEAKFYFTRTPSDQPALHELRKVVALGIACFEQHGVPVRGMYEKP